MELPQAGLGGFGVPAGGYDSNEASAAAEPATASVSILLRICAFVKVGF